MTTFLDGKMIVKMEFCAPFFFCVCLLASVAQTDMNFYIFALRRRGKICNRRGSLQRVLHTTRPRILRQGTLEDDYFLLFLPVTIMFV